VPSYDVLIKRTPTLIKVKDGWSWPAFFFGPWWALAKNMWVVMAWLIALWLALRVLEYILPWSGGINALIAFAIWLPLGIFVGMKANSWYRKHLEARGFSFHASGDDSTAEKVIIDGYAEAESS
jgi:hypothetical protein